MPTYQYSCTDCGHFFEIFQSFSDDSLTVCPTCDGRLRKVFNAVGVVFKGSGFYRNDSRKPDGKSGSSEKGSSESGSSEKGSSESGSSEKGSKKPAETSTPTTAKKPDSSSSAPAASA